MKIRCRKNQSGIALIIVLIVIAILAVLAGNFAASMKVETMLARNSSFDADFESGGRSGIECAKAILSEVKDPFICLTQTWALPHDYPFGENAILHVEIEDQERYFNINMADEMILGQALNLIGVDAGQRSTIIDSILDWKDADDNTHMSGAESSDYKSSPWLPHVAKNGFIDDMSELLLVHGITEQPQVYSHAYASPGASVISRHSRFDASKFQDVAYETTLTDLFTSVSGRAVNINTCNAKVLQLLLPEIDETIANSLIGLRNGPDGVPGSEEDTPFRSVGEMGRSGIIQPPALAILSRLCTTTSLIFKVTVKVNLGGMTRTYHALLRRNSQRDAQVLCMDWE